MARREGGKGRKKKTWTGTRVSGPGGGGCLGTKKYSGLNPSIFPASPPETKKGETKKVTLAKGQERSWLQNVGSNRPATLSKATPEPKTGPV